MHSRRRGATRHDPPPGPGLVNVNASVSVLAHLTTRAPMTYGIRGDTHNTGAGHYQRPWLHCSGCITPDTRICRGEKKSNGASNRSPMSDQTILLRLIVSQTRTFVICNEQMRFSKLYLLDFTRSFDVGLFLE